MCTIEPKAPTRYEIIGLTKAEVVRCLEALGILWDHGVVHASGEIIARPMSPSIELLKELAAPEWRPGSDKIVIDPKRRR